MLRIDNARVFGMTDSFVASGYPMCKKVTDDTLRPKMGTIERLASSPIGSGHDQFLTGIIVQFDLTAPIKFWTEMQRYHFMDFVSSQSTMHRLAKMDLLSADVFDENTDTAIIARLGTLQNAYNTNPTEENFLRLVMSCPTGLNLTARMTTNYRQLKTIYKQRKTHRLPHWRKFCEFLENLPRCEWVFR